MRHIPTVAGALLGLAFVFAGLAFLIGGMPADQMPPADSPAGQFFGAFVPTGFLTFVKVLELVGGLLVAIPKTRRAGLLVLGPILVNILAFHVFVLEGAMLADPMLIGVVALMLVLVWSERRAFAAFVCACGGSGGSGGSGGAAS